ncbi:hypothetical protein evm_000302 [Chilo suppressalis]|nr:hypothetical protein evm_000302 [Chilo suppressalis]
MVPPTREVPGSNPAGDCKVRWINIRDVHRRILKKNIANPNNRSRQYKYEVQLAFMKPFYKDVAFTSSDYDNDDKSLWEEDANDLTAFTEPIEDSDDSEKPIQKLVGKKGGRKRKKKLTYAEEEEKPEVSFNETASADFDPADPVDAFLLSIGATLKTFNAYHLNLAKSKIFAVVQEHDLQQIVQKSNEVKMPNTEVMYME